MDLSAFCDKSTAKTNLYIIMSIIQVMFSGETTATPGTILPACNNGKLRTGGSNCVVYFKLNVFSCIVALSLI